MNGITLLFVGLAAGTAIGTLVEPDMFSGAAQPAVIGSTPYENLSRDRKNFWPEDLAAPSLDLALIPDVNRGYNLVLNLTNFELTPAQMNGAVTPGTGHGHLFVNGENWGRIYGEMLHLIDLPKGEVSLHVYMGGNDHKVWIVDGQPFFAEETFRIE